VAGGQIEGAAVEQLEQGPVPVAGGAGGSQQDQAGSEQVGLAQGRGVGRPVLRSPAVEAGQGAPVEDDEALVLA
jgi:hypothetical protein